MRDLNGAHTDHAQAIVGRVDLSSSSAKTELATMVAASKVCYHIVIVHVTVVSLQFSASTGHPTDSEL